MNRGVVNEDLPGIGVELWEWRAIAKNVQNGAGEQQS
jgi:hypothetical protein